MRWYAWLLGVIVALFLYFGASQAIGSVVTGTASSDDFVRNVVPFILGLVGIAVPVMIIGSK